MFNNKFCILLRMPVVVPSGVFNQSNSDIFEGLGFINASRLFTPMCTDHTVHTSTIDRAIYRSQIEFMGSTARVKLSA